MRTWLLHFHTLLSLGHVPHTYLIPCLLSFLGSCAHEGLQKVSRPIVVQLNWRGFSYKAGTWGRDSAPNSSSSLYWVAPLRTDGRWVQDDFSSATRFIPNVSFPIRSLCGCIPDSSISDKPLGKCSQGLTCYLLVLLSWVKDGQDCPKFPSQIHYLKLLIPW